MAGESKTIQVTATVETGIADRTLLYSPVEITGNNVGPAKVSNTLIVLPTLP